MTIRNYGSYDDEALRRALGADPDDIDAVIEAAKRFERVEKTDAEFDELEDKITRLESDLEGAQQTAKDWEEDYEEECKLSAELQTQIDTLNERVRELEAAGAGLV